MKIKNQLGIIQKKYKKVAPFLAERGKRIWVATEAQALGYGGQRIVHQATGMSINTIPRGIQELQEEQTDPLPKERMRKKGGGRKPNLDKDKTLKEDILAMVEASTKGNPEAPLLWCSKSLRKIAQEINKHGDRASHTQIGTILAEEGYSLQLNRKVKEGGNNPDRDEQFNFISKKTKAFQAKNEPVISVDTKKKELIGAFKNGGKEYAKKGQPTQVNVYDFIDETKGKVVPYGIYDISKNNGYVNVGISADTAEFSVNSIRRWWYEMGAKSYQEAKEIYINADGGGSNGWRVRLWKIELQKLANEIKKTIHVSHFPPGTSKWNKIEHKMFCFISKNWRGKPLVDKVTVVQLIGNTTTQKGLTIKAKLDEKEYQKGIKVVKEELEKINLVKEGFHGEWNYKIIPHK